MQQGHSNGEFFEFSLTSEETPVSQPRPGPDRPRRRPWAWLAVIAGLSTLIVAGFVIFGPDSFGDAPEQPQPVATTTPPEAPAIDPITPVLISSPQQWLAEPVLAWTLTLADFDNARSLRLLMDRLTDQSGNTSDTVVIEVEGGGTKELVGIDTHTGDVLWQFPIDREIRKCFVIAQGHQVACIKAGATKSYVTVLATTTGEVYGTTNWQTDCVPYAVAGSAERLVIAGKTRAEDAPCLAAGALWETRPDVALPHSPMDFSGPGMIDTKTTPGADMEFFDSASPWEKEFAFLRANDSHILVNFHDAQLIATLDLQQEFSTFYGSHLTLNPTLGPLQLDQTSNLAQASELLTTARALKPTPPELLKDAFAEADDKSNDAALTDFLNDGELWDFTHVLSNPGGDIRIGTRYFGQDAGVSNFGSTRSQRGEPESGVILTPDGGVAIVSEVVEEEDPRLSDYTDTYGSTFTLKTQTQLFAYDTTSGEKLWTATADAALVNPIYRGDALIWTTSSGTESQLRALNLTTGEWEWTLENAPTQLDASDANWFTNTMVGDVLIRPSHNSVDGFITEPTTE